MSKISALSSLGESVLNGIRLVNHIVNELDIEFIPNVGPILLEIGRIITAIEISGKDTSEDTLNNIVQYLTAANIIKQVIARE